LIGGLTDSWFTGAGAPDAPRRPPIGSSRPGCPSSACPRN